MAIRNPKGELVPVHHLKVINKTLRAMESIARMEREMSWRVQSSPESRRRFLGRGANRIAKKLAKKLPRLAADVAMTRRQLPAAFVRAFLGK